MLVSILMPMRNAEKFVRDAARSVLATTSVPLELIVIDDGSTDASKSVVAGLGDSRVRLIDGPRTGIADCLNTGLRHAKGDILMRCDADDLFPAGRIEAQHRWLAEHPECAAVCGAFEMIDPDGAVVATPFSAAVENAEDIAGELKDGQLRTHLCTFAMRRSAIDAVGEFRRYFETAEDLDFAFRLGQAGSVGFLNRTFYRYRIHPTSITHIQAKARREFFERTARAFAVQRRDEGFDALMRGAPPAPPVDGGKARDAGEHLYNLETAQAWLELERGARARAVTLGLRSVARRPLRLGAWINLAKLVLKSMMPSPGDGVATRSVRPSEAAGSPLPGQPARAASSMQPDRRSTTADS